MNSGPDFLEIARGDGPLVLGLPHGGTDVPEEIFARLNARGRALADTDWHVHDLYAGLAKDATTVRTTVHRYVIDVNRDPADESLYPGRNTTGLCPQTDFDGQGIYRVGQAHDAGEVAARQEAFHAPYHAALRAELERVRRRHGFALLYDCHSIRSRIPFLFDGTLPDFNIGTDGGTTCAPGIEAITGRLCAAAPGYDTVLNGRFRGGWTTRHYGRPADGIHAIQMELAQSTYLSAQAPPWEMNPTRATRVRRHLGSILATLSDWRPT